MVDIPIDMWCDMHDPQGQGAEERMSSREPVEVFVEVMVVRPLSLRVFTGDDEVWIPKSQICEDSPIGQDAEDGDEGSLIIPRWLAEEKELV